ncbi:MAG: hypothetical protein ACRD7E_25715, partial [Bryobacteraceae bacterium]
MEPRSEYERLWRNSRTTDSRGAAKSAEFFFRLVPRRAACALLTRRHFFGRSAYGIGAAALAGLLGEDLQAREGGLTGIPHFPPRAARVIYLFQSGGPSQM